MNDFVKQSLDDEHIGIGSNEVFFNVIEKGEFGDAITTFSKFEEITKAIFTRIISPYTPSYQFRARTLKPFAIKKKENYRGENVKSAPNVVVDRRSIIGNIFVLYFICRVSHNLHYYHSIDIFRTQR